MKTADEGNQGLLPPLTLKNRKINDEVFLK